MGVKCFLIERTRTVRRYLRRYAPGTLCEAAGVGCHDAMVPFEDVDVGVDYETVTRPEGPHDPELWPRACACGYVFTAADEYQLFGERLYSRDGRAEAGETFTLRNAPPGAMYWADWMEGVPAMCGADGRSLVVVLPNGNPWMIDGIANNCADAEDAYGGGHKCWIRHGEAPEITVDKNGKTCAAGAGSIQSCGYHGFLRSGYLVEC